MLVSLKANLAFLAMTKTGSTALEAAMASHCDIRFSGNPKIRHMNAGRFEKFVRPYLSAVGHGDVETFCLMRDPVDWLASWWRYRQRSQLVGTAQSTKDISFDEFVTLYLDGHETLKSIGRPSRFVAGPDKSPIVKHILPYEQMPKAIAFLEDRLQVPLDVDRLNVSPVVPADLPGATLAKLKDALSVDFDLHREISERAQNLRP